MCCHHSESRVGRVYAPLLLLLLGGLFQTHSNSEAAQKAVTRTPVPRLYEDWKVAVTGAGGTDAAARAEAEQQRPRVIALPDPFTPLAEMTCVQRQVKAERIVWEDATLMALVDFGNRGTKLLVVPKKAVNFPIDLTPDERAHVSRVAAATCDALVVASRDEFPAKGSSCRVHVNPPVAVTVRQMHVHVEAQTSISGPVDDAYLKRTAAHLRSLVGGGGCF